MSDGVSEPPLSVKTGSSLTESVPDKVVLVGDVGVGKTSLFLRFKTGQFHQTTPSHNPRDGEHQKEWTLGTRKVSVSVPGCRTCSCSARCTLDLFTHAVRIKKIRVSCLDFFRVHYYALPTFQSQVAKTTTW